MIINKRLSRNVKKHKAFFIGSILLCTLTVAFIIAAISTGSMMMKTVDQFFEDCNVEDAQFNVVTALTDEDISQLKEDYNVDLEQVQYFDVEKDDITIRVFRESDKINLYQLKEGDSLSDGNILMSKEFADENDYDLKDKLDVSGKDYSITGYFTRPDYIFPLKTLSDSYSDNKSFGIALMTQKDFDTLEDTVSYYSVVYHKENSKDFRKELNDKYTLISYLSKDSNTRISSGEREGRAVSGMAYAYSPFLFILNMGLIAVVLSRMLKTERGIVGVLTAQGYKKREIISYYMKYALITAVAGSVLGAILGAGLIKPFLNLYCSDFLFPKLIGHFSVGSLVVGLVAPVILFSLTAVLVVRSMLKKTVVQLLRGGRDDKVKRNSKFLLKCKLSNSTKYGIRSVMRNKGRTVVFIFGVFVASALVLYGLIMNTSCNLLLNKYLKGSTNYEYAYYFTQIQTEYEYDTGEPFIQGSFETQKGQSFSLIGIDYDTEFYSLSTEDGSEMDDDCVYISKAFSALIGKGEGDKLSFINPITLEEYSVDIDGIADVRTQKSIYMSREKANELLNNEEQAYNGIYSDKKLDIDSDILAMKQKGSDSEKAFETLLRPLSSVIYILVALGIILGTIAITIITSMIVDENKNNISMLKVLGYKVKEISKMVLNINNVLVLITYIISIPIMVKMCEVSFKAEIESLNVFIEAKFTILNLVLGFVLVYGGYFITLLISRKKIMKVDMIESLKDNRE